MNNTLTLDQLQIKRRELENELTELVQREQELQVNLKNKEKAVIEELEFIITDKKVMIQNLDSQNTSLGKKLSRLKKNKQIQPPTQSTTDTDNEESEDEIEFTVVQETPNHPNHSKTKIQSRKEKKFFF